MINFVLAKFLRARYFLFNEAHTSKKSYYNFFRVHDMPERRVWDLSKKCDFYRSGIFYQK